MYSWEIDQLLKAKQYLLTAKEYINICKSSPQINRIKYNPYDNNFEIWTKDNYYCKFKVKKK